MIKVLFYCYELPPMGGGVSRAAYELLKVFSRVKSLEIDVLTSSCDGKFKTQRLHKQILIHHLPSLKKGKKDLVSQKWWDMVWFVIVSFIYSYRLHKEKEYQVSHVFGYPGALVAWCFKKKTPYIVSLRGVDVPNYNSRFGKWYKLYKLIALKTWKESRYIVANSEDLKSLALESCPELEISVIKNGVDCRKFKPASANKKYKKWWITSGGVILGKRKRLDRLIEACAKVMYKYDNVRLMIIGDGDEKQFLKQQVKKLQLSAKVKFYGRKNQTWLSKTISRCRVCCLPSAYEGMSNSVLEAMACGLPLVVSNTGGASELVIKNGIILKKGEVEEIGDAIEFLYNHPQKLLTMGKNSRRKALELSWTKTGKAYINIYKIFKD